jgi:hypothetical protein
MNPLDNGLDVPNYNLILFSRLYSAARKPSFPSISASRRLSAVNPLGG